MDTGHLKLVEVARRFLAVGLQAASAYNSEQAKLRLDLVLTQDRLSSEAGTRESRETIDQLRQLTVAHRAAFQKVALAAASELSATAAELPGEGQDEVNAGLVSSINWQLKAQADFYATREQWMDASEAICDLFDAERGAATFSDDGVDFESDDTLARFTQLLEVIEQAHQAEVAAIKERLERLGRATAVLGIGASS